MQNLFPERPKVFPQIYAYADTAYNGLLKIGYTTKNVQERVKEQYPIKRPTKTYSILLEEPAYRKDGSCFTDKDVHTYLKKKGYNNPEGEWFECKIEDVKNAILSIQEGKELERNRTQTFVFRPEQEEAVRRTKEYFTSLNNTINHTTNSTQVNVTNKFLWNAKMRFGKTFATYKLAQSLNYSKILILTFKPAVQSAWEEDLLTHVDFEGWQFISRNTQGYENADKSKPIVCFGSFQDYLGTNSNGGIKAKNEWVHTTNWDLVVFDEYHFGAWRENAKKIFDNEDEDTFEPINIDEYREKEAPNALDETFLPITSKKYLYLSGTPFRAIATGEFIEEQIYNWTYSDEQKAKEEWDINKGKNPYLSLPRVVLLTYQLPDEILQIAKQGEYNEFDLNEFFNAYGNGQEAVFKHEEEVQKWLNLIRGAYAENTVSILKLGKQKPVLPFSDIRLLSALTHTFWFLPSVSSCHAMANLLKKKQNAFYHDYKVIVCAGAEAGIGLTALDNLRQKMGNPLSSKSITLSCGKLTTGVSVSAWSGIFMLRNTSSPETYFQSAFRVQTPWTVKNPDSLSPNKEEILKEECYIFDFAPNRALRQIADYSCRLNINEENPEKKVEEFISFLPILAYDGSSMKEINASGVLEMAMSGTTATLLAKRWESALLVNVDNMTLAKLLNNEEALNAIMSIEGFRSLNKDIETIINKAEAVKKLKLTTNERPLTPAEKEEMKAEEKEYKNKRKEIQDKLIKFATRIPIFMYLTDIREITLRDVITQIEPELFKKVTGLTIPYFELLVSIGLFNSGLMNDAVYKFYRYENPSLEYMGLNKHSNETHIGLYDTVINKEDEKRLGGNSYGK